ncbi:hypothetical protein [Nonomuraea dietziae]
MPGPWISETRPSSTPHRSSSAAAAASPGGGLAIGGGITGITRAHRGA